MPVRVNWYIYAENLLQIDSSLNGTSIAQKCVNFDY